MFFETLAVLVITFFASIGMVEVTEWLLKNPFKKRIKHRIFVVAKVSSVPEEEIEPALRSILAETNGINRSIILDCDGASEGALSICRSLERRFDCSLCRGSDEVLRLFDEGLHTV